MRCYDGNGFADVPGGLSDLQSTLNAITLLMGQPNEWAAGTWQAVEHIVQNYARMQSPDRGGFVLSGSDAPDFKTTALVLETLKVLDRLDSIDFGMAERYLWSSFRGSLTLDKLLTDGDFYTQYWAIRAAKAIGRLYVLGFQDIALSKVISPGANRADFPEIEPYLVWGKQFFEGNSTYASPFKSLAYEEQTDVIQVLDILINNDTIRPTVMNLLLDVNGFVDETRQSFDVNTGLFKDNQGGKDLTLSARAYVALDRVGRLQSLFNDDWGAYRVVRATQHADALNTDWIGETKSETASLNSLVSLNTVKQTQQRIDKPVDTYVPAFEPVREEGQTGISTWNHKSEQTVFVPDILWKDLQTPETREKNPTTPVATIVLVSLGLAVVVSLAGNKKRLAVILSVFCVLLFVGDSVYAMDSIAKQGAAFLSSTILPSTGDRKYPCGNSRMTCIGTAWVKLSYGTVVTAKHEAEGSTVGSPTGGSTTAFLGADFLDRAKVVLRVNFAKLINFIIGDCEADAKLIEQSRDMSVKLSSLQQALADAVALANAGDEEAAIAAAKAAVSEWFQSGDLKGTIGLTGVLEYLKEGGYLTLKSGEKVAAVGILVNDGLLVDKFGNLVSRPEDTVAVMIESPQDLQAPESAGPNSHYRIFMFSPPSRLDDGVDALVELGVHLNAGRLGCEERDYRRNAFEDWPTKRCPHEVDEYYPRRKQATGGQGKPQAHSTAVDARRRCGDSGPESKEVPEPVASKQRHA